MVNTVNTQMHHVTAFVQNSAEGGEQTWQHFFFLSHVQHQHVSQLLVLLVREAQFLARRRVTAAAAWRAAALLR